MAKMCPECGERFDDAAELCPYDGVDLEHQDDDADSLVGKVVDDRFRLERLLGEGGMGRVYEATQLSVERRVAVKLIRYKGVPDRSVRERFEREARVVSELNHPNIVRLIDFGRDEARDAPYIAMEFIDGLEVHRLVERARMHPNLALEIAAQIAAALVEAHGADIVHRDLKTDNALLVPVSSGGFQVKVIDFGIAFPRTTSKRLTNTGMICGTPRYVSPEQARGGEIGQRSDLYSLGVVIFEMTTGMLPFEADSAFNVMMKHVQEKPPSLRGTLPPEELPEGLAELVDDLLRKDPEQRPAGAREVRRRIETIRENNDWGAIEVDPGGDLEEELQEWLLPSLEESSDGYEVVDDAGAGPAFSAPDFDSEVNGSSADEETAETTDREVPGEKGAPDVVGVPGQTGAPLGQVTESHDGETPAPTEEMAPTEPAADPVEEASEEAPEAESAPLSRRSGVAVALLVAVAAVGLYWAQSSGEGNRTTDHEPGAKTSTSGAEPNERTAGAPSTPTAGRGRPDPAAPPPAEGTADTAVDARAAPSTAKPSPATPPSAADESAPPDEESATPAERSGSSSETNSGSDAPPSKPTRPETKAGERDPSGEKGPDGGEIEKALDQLMHE